MKGRAESGRCRRGALWLLCLACLACVACERKTPGPFECEAAGARALGITHRSQLSDPRVKQALDLWTVECLTTPFDRQLLRCVEETGRAQLCLHDFRRRHPELLPPDQRPSGLRRR